MNQKLFGDAEPAAGACGAAHDIKMLVAIVNRGDAEKAARLFSEHHMRVHFTVLAEGTSRSEIMTLLGLGSTERAVALCLSHRKRIDALLPEVRALFRLEKAGNGIAFTIPLSGLVTGLPWPAAGGHVSEEMNLGLEKEVEEMIEGESFTHDLILAVINHGYSEDLVAAARAVGAHGATIINARRTGMDDAVKFLGITLQEEREIVAILSTREGKLPIMNALNEKFGMKSRAHGIILSLPVDSVEGIAG